MSKETQVTNKEINRQWSDFSKVYYQFKVKDYTTILVGQKDEATGKFYVQRGDGEKYEYWPDQIEWSKKLQAQAELENIKSFLRELSLNHALAHRIEEFLLTGKIEEKKCSCNDEKKATMYFIKNWCPDCKLYIK